VNYRELFDKVYQLMSSPAKAWEAISAEEDRRKATDAFVYPMIGLCALSVFLGTLFTADWGVESLQQALRNCCVEAAALFVGCLLAAFGIDFLQSRMLRRESNMVLAKQFAGYAMVVIFIIRIVVGILPDLTLIGWMLQFYTIYVVWEGIPVMMHAADPQRFRLTVCYSFLLLVCPVVVQMLFSKILPDLN
jgi:hypothetical protein